MSKNWGKTCLKNKMINDRRNTSIINVKTILFLQTKSKTSLHNLLRSSIIVFNYGKHFIEHISSMISKARRRNSLLIKYQNLSELNWSEFQAPIQVSFIIKDNLDVKLSVYTGVVVSF